MDGAAAGDRYQTADVIVHTSACRRANALLRRFAVRQGAAMHCADLGGSSNYSTAIFED